VGAKEIISKRKHEAGGEGKLAFQMAIVDPNLDLENKDLSGMSIIEDLQSVLGCRILMITGESNPGARLKDWGNLRVHCFLEKPFGSRELLEAINEALELEGRKLKEWMKIHEEDRKADQEAQEEHVERMQLSSGTETPAIAMSKALQELVSVKPGTVAHVFRLHPRSFRTQSLANAGGSIKWQPLRGKIGKSPIKDVAFSDVPIFEKVSDGKRSHLWTLEMVNYEAFCGIPIIVSDNNRYALVAFHNEADAFDDSFRLSAMLCAEKVAHSLDRQKLLERTGNEATFAAAGMTFGSLAHELYNHLTAANSQALLVKVLLDRENPLSDSDRRECRERVDRIYSQTKRAIEKAEALRGTRGRTEPVSIQRCLRGAAVACRRILEETVVRPENIQIDLPPEEPEEEWCVRAMPGALIIILFNLYLNAVQQIDLMRQIRRRGRVWHSLERRKDEKGKLWAFVRIHDTGPGIHPDDWERVFEPGYTTKEKGVGLGLYICRHLLRSIYESGRYANLRVTRSVLWDGTTFALKLPLSDL
jgi:signal transduction histidine kinase